MALEKLNRGVVALRHDNQVVVSWRILSFDRKGEAFDVYRNGEKMNKQPLMTGGAFFVDKNPLTGDATYEVRGGGLNGSYVLKAGAPDGYLPVKLQKPADGQTPDGRTFSYSANDASVADVDGDGCDEITYGSMAVDHDGRGLYNTGMGHGDAIHLMAFDPLNR